MVERIMVPFAGGGAGTGPLAWGQQQVWRAMVEVNSSMSMGGAVPIQDGRTVGDFVRQLQFFMQRYGAMRSLLRFAPDGSVTQEVFATGTATLEVHDAGGAAGDPAAVAEAVLAEWRARNFDYVTEWPIRMGVVRDADAAGAGTGGAVTHLIVLICHLAADGGGVATMIRELGECDPVTGQAAGPHTAMQPLDLVASQSGPAAQRTTANAMRYWEGQLRAVQPHRFAAVQDRGEPRWRRIVWQSPALLLASERLAARLGVDDAAVLLAAYAVAFGRVAGGSPFVAQVIVGNRFRPGLADVVSPLAQNGLVAFDVAGVGAEEAVQRARQASMSASKYAYYDPATRLALIDRIGAERGERLDLAVFYNDRRVMQRPAGLDRLPTEPELRAAQSRTEVLQEIPLVFFNEELMVNIDDVADTVQITTEVDTRCLSMQDVRTLLLEMESFTVEASVDPSLPTGVRACSPLRAGDR